MGALLSVTLFHVAAFQKNSPMHDRLDRALRPGNDLNSTLWQMELSVCPLIRSAEQWGMVTYGNATTFRTASADTGNSLFSGRISEEVWARGRNGRKPVHSVRTIINRAGSADGRETTSHFHQRVNKGNGRAIEDPAARKSFPRRSTFCLCFLPAFMAGRFIPRLPLGLIELVAKLLFVSAIRAAYADKETRI